MENTVDPLSIMIKSLQIDIYNICSQELYERFKTARICPIIPHNKVDAVKILLNQMSIFSFCSTQHLRNEISILNERLIGK